MYKTCKTCLSKVYFKNLVYLRYPIYKTCLTKLCKICLTTVYYKKTCLSEVYYIKYVFSIPQAFLRTCRIFSLPNMNKNLHKLE